MNEVRLQRERIRYTGRVQGVGFRQTVADLAAKMPISGWVCNEPDGSVTCVAEGQESALEAFIEAIGCAMAGGIESAVRQVEPKEMEVFEGFHIKFSHDSRR